VLGCESLFTDEKAKRSATLRVRYDNEVDKNDDKFDESVCLRDIRSWEAANDCSTLLPTEDRFSFMLLP